MDHINDYVHLNHHDLDIKPVPEQVLYINEPDITGDFCGGGNTDQRYDGRAVLMKYDGDTASRYAYEFTDQVRVYVPLNLSKQHILAYFKAVMNHFGHADEKNEMMFSSAIDQVITRLEIYDQIWFTRELSESSTSNLIDPDINEDSPPHHSCHASEIARLIVDELAQLAKNGCVAQHFPYETIDMLCYEYGFKQPF